MACEAGGHLGPLGASAQAWLDADEVDMVTPSFANHPGAAPVGQPGAAPAGQPAGQCPQGGTALAAADVLTGHLPAAGTSASRAAASAELPAAAPAQRADAAGSSTGQLGARGRIPRAGLSPAEWAACPWRLGQPGPYDWEIP